MRRIRRAGAGRARQRQSSSAACPKSTRARAYTILIARTQPVAGRQRCRSDVSGGAAVRKWAGQTCAEVSSWPSRRLPACSFYRSLLSPCLRARRVPAPRTVLSCALPDTSVDASKDKRTPLLSPPLAVGEPRASREGRTATDNDAQENAETASGARARPQGSKSPARR